VWPRGTFAFHNGPSLKKLSLKRQSALDRSSEPRPQPREVGLLDWMTRWAHGALSKTFLAFPELNQTHVRFCDRFLTFSFTASVINLFFQEKAEARVSGVRYFNFAILMLVLYALITLNPYALYKYFTKKRKRPKDGSKPKKKRIRVLNYEPIPDYTEQKTSRSEKSSNTSESS